MAVEVICMSVERSPDSEHRFAGKATQSTRQRRLLQLGAIVVAAFVVIAIIAVTVGGGSHINQSAPTATSQLAGIPQSGDTLGLPTAPVTLLYFGDLECPFCREFTLGSLPTLISKYVRTGKLMIQYHSLETATREPGTFIVQQVAALAAGQQNRMWDYIELFYHEQGSEDSGYVTEPYLQKLAEQVPGLNLSQWISDRNNSALATQVKNDVRIAHRLGFHGTPSFLLGRTDGGLRPFSPSSLVKPSLFESAIKKLQN
jgi:protein-disulfide isomerase